MFIRKHTAINYSNVVNFDSEVRLQFAALNKYLENNSYKEGILEYSEKHQMYYHIYKLKSKPYRIISFYKIDKSAKIIDCIKIVMEKRK